MTVGEAGSILELSCFEVVGPTSVDFVDLCAELRDRIDEKADCIVVFSEKYNKYEQEAAAIWLESIDSERSRVLEEMALEWMTADEQIESFGNSYK